MRPDARGELALFANGRHAHGERVDEQNRPRLRDPPHDLEVEVATIVVPPVFPAYADDAVEVRLAARPFHLSTYAESPLITGQQCRASVKRTLAR